MMHWDYRVFFEEGSYTIRTVYADVPAQNVRSKAKRGKSLEAVR